MHDRDNDPLETVGAAGCLGFFVVLQIGLWLLPLMLGIWILQSAGCV